MKSFFSRMKKDILEKFYTYRSPKFMADDPRYKDFDIGAYTYGSPKIMRWENKTRLSIGRYCSFAKDVTILLGGEHNTHWVTTYPLMVFIEELNHCVGHPASRGDITIGNDVWVGYRATILSGANIGDGAIIGAGAIVTSDVPPYAIVAGAPAKLVRYRFDQQTITRLLEIQWWNWSLKEIKKHGELLLSPDTDKILALRNGETDS